MDYLERWPTSRQCSPAAPATARDHARPSVCDYLTEYGVEADRLILEDWHPTRRRTSPFPGNC
ncbi:MAG: hypothetical protein ACLTYN_08275 [Dysosmobacter welbionis]